MYKRQSLTRFTNEPREAFENCFNEVVGLLEEGDLPDKYKIDLTDFKAQIASTSREITDRITRHYDRRVSLDDDECVEILEIYDIYTEFVGQSPLNPFRNLNENGMNKVLEYISDLESTGNYKPAEIIPIHVIRERKVFYNTVSAGTGSFLDSDEYEMISSPDIPEAATFGVYVDGDSMEPRYHNKDLIWIEQTACLDDGEIGIFYLDGNAYVKKFQNNRLGTYLISLNKKYDPIPVTENSSFKIFGRVLS